MTKCILMNFDDRTRVVHNALREAVVLRIGSLTTVDLDEPTAELIQRAMNKTADPLVIVPSATEHSPEALSLMTLLQDLETGPYDEILQRCTELLGADNVGGPRPSRHELRHKLRTIAAGFASGDVKQDAAAIQSKAAKVEKEMQTEKDSRRTQDDVDPDKLDEDLRKQREADRKKRRDAEPIKSMGTRAEPTEREVADDVLGIVTGGDVNQLGAALNQAPKGDDPDAFDPATAKRQKRPSAKKASKGAKKAAPKRTASAGKRSTAAKKPVGRVRA